MTETTPKASNGVPLQQWFEERLSSLQTAILTRFDTKDREMDKMEQQINERIRDNQANVDRRFQSVESYKEQTRHLAEGYRDQCRDAIAAIEKGLDARMKVLEMHKANLEGRFLVIGGIWGLVVVLFSVLVNFAIRKAFGA